MSYEIPQSLQYKEKIVFNLTIEQLLYATVFGLTAFLIYAKLSFSIYTRISLALIPIALGLMFMYLDLRRRILDIWTWFKFRKVSKFDPKMKRYLKLNAIEKGCYTIQTGKGEKRVAVLLVEPLNFKIKPKDERNTIIYSFQKFLNALDFPVQLLMYTDDLNLNRYMTALEKKVDKTNNETYKELVKDHQNYLNQVMKERIAMNRRFLVVVQENSIGLDAQLNIISDLLKSMNLKNYRLGSKQLIKVLMRLFNNENKEKISKKEKLYNLIAPSTIQNNPDNIKVNNHYNRIITAVGYPRTVEEGFLDKVVTAAGNFDLSIHIEPFPIETTMMMLNKELQKQRADLYAAEMKHSFSPSLEIQYKDTRGVLDSIQKGEEKLFHVSLYINVKAKDMKELNLLTKSIESQLNSILIIPQVPKYRMAQGLKSILPFGTNELGIRRNITTYALSAFFPFTSQFLIHEEGGVFLGLNKNHLPVIKDIFNLPNANGVILATSGSGKSYAAKLLLSRYLMTGTQVITIDPQNEYSRLAESFKGSIIELSRKSKTMINPLDPMGRPEAEKRLALMETFVLMFGQLTEPQRAILDRALSLTYEAARKRKKGQESQKIPTLHDLYTHLESLSKKANMYERGTYTALLNRLSMYTTGVFSFLNRQTELELDNQFTVFNIGNVPKQVKPLLMFLVLEFVYAQMKKSRDRKLLVIDEAWSLLARAEEEGYIFEIAKTCRKWNLGLLLITQDAEDLLASRAGRAVLGNSSYTLLLRQKPAAIHAAERVFNLSFPERELLLTATVGQGLLIMDNDHQEINIVASEKEHQIITTNPNEIKNEPAEEPEKPKLALDRWMYRKRQFDKEGQASFALNNGYHWSSYRPILAKRAEQVLTRKPAKNWTDEHANLTWDGKGYFEKLGLKVELYVGKSGDLTPDFTVTDTANKKWPVETETGINLTKNLLYLKEKLRKVIKTYKRCVILNAYASFHKRYERLASEISDQILVVSRDDIPKLAEIVKDSSAGVHNNIPRLRFQLKKYRRKTQNKPAQLIRKRKRRLSAQ